MANFSAQLHVKRIEMRKFTKAFQSAAMGLIYRAAREWLRAVILEVPIWTGFAQGSIKFAQGPKGALARYLRVAMPISPRSQRPKYYRHPTRARRIRKVPEEAGRFGTYNFLMIQGTMFRFNFRTDVVHYILNEFYEHPHVVSAPWWSLRAGGEAFMRYIKAHHLELPQWHAFAEDLPLFNMTNSQARLIGHSGKGD